MKKIIPILILVITSCNTAKRSVKNINKGFSIDSAAAAKRVREIVPCVTVMIDTTSPKLITTTTTDTIKTVVTDTVKLKCKDGTLVDTVIKRTLYDINHRITKTNTYYITKTIEDKSKDITINDLNNNLEKQTSKKHFWMWWAIVSTIVILLIVIAFLLSRSLKIKP